MGTASRRPGGQPGSLAIPVAAGRQKRNRFALWGRRREMLPAGSQAAWPPKPNGAAVDSGQRLGSGIERQRDRRCTGRGSCGGGRRATGGAGEGKALPLDALPRPAHRTGAAGPAWHREWSVHPSRRTKPGLQHLREARPWQRRGTCASSSTVHMAPRSPGRGYVPCHSEASSGSAVSQHPGRIARFHRDHL